MIRRPGPFEDDRKCAEPDCPTVLSTHNGGSQCWLHSTSEPATQRAARGDFIDLLDELLGGRRAA